jgi:hypothetical protein
MKSMNWRISNVLGWTWNRMGVDARTRFSTQDRAAVIDLLINGCSEPMVQLHDAVDQALVMTMVRPDLIRKVNAGLTLVSAGLIIFTL